MSLSCDEPKGSSVTVEAFYTKSASESILRAHQFRLRKRSDFHDIDIENLNNRAPFKKVLLPRDLDMFWAHYVDCFEETEKLSQTIWVRLVPILPAVCD